MDTIFTEYLFIALEWLGRSDFFPWRIYLTKLFFKSALMYLQSCEISVEKTPHIATDFSVPDTLPNQFIK